MHPRVVQNLIGANHISSSKETMYINIRIYCYIYDLRVKHLEIFQQWMIV